MLHRFVQTAHDIVHHIDGKEVALNTAVGASGAVAVAVTATNWLQLILQVLIATATLSWMVFRAITAYYDSREAKYRSDHLPRDPAPEPRGGVQPVPETCRTVPSEGAGGPSEDIGHY
jgi:hypothetical protein